MIEKVYRDINGKVINIGEWDYVIETIHQYDDDGEIIGSEDVVHNPLPDDVTFSDEEIIVHEDGSRSAVSSASTG